MWSRATLQSAINRMIWHIVRYCVRVKKRTVDNISLLILRTALFVPIVHVGFGRSKSAPSKRWPPFLKILKLLGNTVVIISERLLKVVLYCVKESKIGSSNGSCNSSDSAIVADYVFTR